MTEEERKQVMWWTVSALVNVWGGWFTAGGPALITGSKIPWKIVLSEVIGTISLSGEIATDLGCFDPDLNSTLVLASWIFGFYLNDWEQDLKIMNFALGFTKDSIYLTVELVDAYHRRINPLQEKSSSMSENALNTSNPIENKDEKKASEPAKNDSEIPKEKTNPESKTGVREDDGYFGSNITETQYPNESNVECGYGSCQCVSGDCSGATGDNMPSDPNEDVSDAIQKILMTNILAKMLKRGESEQPPVFVDTGTGPNGAIKIYRNPYYVSKDPLKTILFNGDNGSGKPMIYRNPFVPGAKYGYDSTTYERWQNSGFPQTNVDPYFN